MGTNNEEASKLITDGVIDKVATLMRESYIRMWAKQTDQAERDRLWLAYNMVNDCVTMFVTVSQEGYIQDASE